MLEYYKKGFVMVSVEFLGPIEIPTMQLEIGSLAELGEILRTIDESKKWLEVSAIAINDTLVDSLDIELKDGDRICLLPPVCGG